MTEETKQEQHKEEVKVDETRQPNFLDQLKTTKSEIDLALKQADEKLAQLKEFEIEKVMSGTSNAGKPEDKPKEETPSEYAKRVMSGKL